MIWVHSGRKHWTSHDIAGLMLDVQIVQGTSVLRIIDAITGEITKTITFNHPMDAMLEAKRYLPIEAKYVAPRKDERQKAESSNYTPNPEETCTIQESACISR